MNGARIAVGVDAGGTATVAVASRTGVAAGEVRGGPANATSHGVEAAAAEIARTVLAATAGSVPDALYVGAAGAAGEEVARALCDALRERLGGVGALSVAGDAETALRAGVPDGPGIVLIAGTGSLAYAVNGEKRAHVGGFGYLLGDEGSAYRIGFAAIELLSRAYDGRGRADETTALAERVLQCTDRAGLLAALYGAPVDVAKIASMAPSIVAFAGKGNRASTRIVQKAATELGDLVRAAARAVDLAEASPNVAFAGGLLRENTLLSYLLELRVVNEVPGAAIVRVRDEPARTALRFAEAAL
jgi:N-acetylglucosamine kinase-like BadF-type ATPase